MKEVKWPKRKRRSDELLSWFFVGLCLCAAMMLDKHQSTTRWHAAIAWTGIPFSSVVMICRDRWRSIHFWIGWSILFGAHIGLMWLLFSYLFPRVVIGMLYIMPFAFVETFLILMLVNPKWRIQFRSRSRLHKS